MDASSNERWDEDPGWRFSLGSLRAMLPILQTRYYRSLGGDQLVIQRTVFSSFVMAFVWFGIIVTLITQFRAESGEYGWMAAIAIIALANLAIARVVERPLSCESDQVLASSFRTRMFVRIAFAESTVLLGFIGSNIAMGASIYYVGVLVSLPGMLRAAPNRAALVRDQDELTGGGCSRSLVAALRQVPPK